MHSADELVQSLINWMYSSGKKNYWENRHVLIMTIDNPGWGITVDLKDNFPNIKLPLADIANSEVDWYYCTIKDDQFQGDGGLSNLVDIFNVFIRLVNFENCRQKMRLDDNFVWLSQWYNSQCDGNWEHGNGIKIGTIDNPGWYLKVNLDETELEKKDFQIIRINRTENDWIYCEIKETLFEGFGGPFNLQEIVSIFRSWAEQDNNAVDP